MSPSWLLLSFHDARNYCRGLGGDLPQPKNEETVDFLNKTIESDIWIGLSDIESEGTYIWIDKTVRAQRFPSMNSSSSHGEDADCVIIRNTGEWDVQPCNVRMRFVCESTREPTHLIVATATPFGSQTRDPSYLCLLSPPDDTSSVQITTQRLVKISTTHEGNTLVVPGSNNAMIPDTLPVVIDQTLPRDNTAMGVFECKATASGGTVTNVSAVILLHLRQYQPIDGRFTRTIYPADSTSLNVSKLDIGPDTSDIRWQKFKDIQSQDSELPESNGQLSHLISTATHKDADVYGTFTSGQLFNHRHSFIRVIVQDCPRGRWDPPSCLGVCDNCYNGGICHQQSGTCICPPGFSGKNCLTACAEHRFGWECELECGPGHPLDQCAGSQVCLPDPYGCNCLAGYTGIFCIETCGARKFGVDCLQDCHCISGTSCNRYTGNCLEGCEDGWSGPSCQVPTTCAGGYYGENCTEKCHCLDGLPCEKDTGSCLESKGQCAVGYIPDAEGPFDNCRQFSGCYDSCLSTCHCSGGAPDCNSETGSCSSNSCSLRWTGEKCQTDRFSIVVDKTNPGVASFNCSFSTEDLGDTGGINVARNGVLINSPAAIVNHTGIGFVSKSFVLESVSNDEILHCTFGHDISSGRPLLYARISERNFYVLPRLSDAPELLDVGRYHASIAWRQWDPDMDTGEGPIVGYKVYVRSGGSVVLADHVQPSSMTNNKRRSIMKRSADDITSLVKYNIDGLEAGSRYMIQIAAIRDGINGEGEQGPALTFTTERPPLSSASPVTSSTETGRPPSSSIAPVVGGAIGSVIVIVIVIILIIVIYKRKSTRSETGVTTSKSKGKESDSSPQYENPAFDQSMPASNAYQDLNTSSHTYQDLNTDTHAYQDLTNVTMNYQNVSDPHTYQDLKKTDQEANYEELRDATQMKKDYVNVQDI